METFTTLLLQFGEQGEKTGWTYISIPRPIADQIRAGTRKSFRVRGKLDEFAFSGVALLPMGDGNFILAVNATMRRGIRKIKGARVRVQIEEDRDYIPPRSPEFMECLKEDPQALNFFKRLPGSHQHYYFRWIEGAKTKSTKVRRICLAIRGLSSRMSFSEMIRWSRSQPPGIG